MERSVASPDRRTVEKNRRMQMKALYSQVYSVLPASFTKKEGGAAPLPERLELVVNYIKAVQMRVEKMKERKKQLLGADSTVQIKVHTRAGGGLQVIMTSSSKGEWSTFSKVVSILEEDGAEIASANFCVLGNNAIYMVHVLVGEPRSGREGDMLLEKLTMVVWPA